MVGNIKHIVIIESLSGERKTGLEIYNDCIRRRIDYQNLNFTHKYFSVNTKAELIEVLRYYTINAIYFIDGLLFHFEMHGDEELNGLFLSDGTLITWKELIDEFRKINIIIKNKLFIIMATCYGRHLYKGVDPYNKSPFSGYISAREAIYPEEIVDKFIPLYESLLQDGNLVKAYLKNSKNENNFYYKDRKSSFEEAFLSTLNNLYGEQNLKKKIIEDAKKQMMYEINIELSDAENDGIFENALRNILINQYKQFNL